MRKTILLFALFLGALGAQAYTVDTKLSYIYSSEHNQALVGAAVPLGVNTVIGLQGKYVEDKKESFLKDNTYSVYLPLQLDLDLVNLHLTPFYYFKNELFTPGFDDIYAYGLNTQLVMNLQQNEIDETYTQAFVGISYARQKGVLEENFVSDDTLFTQLAYTLGIRQNFFNAFAFQVAGTAFHYPDGISEVNSFLGVLNQNDLAYVQSYDVNRELGKYTLSARITRVWAEEHSTLYFGYHFAEFYTADPQHSFLLGNSFRVGKYATVDTAYNHLRNTDDKDKRDLFFINLNIAF
ncbi:MAG: hypothetical protein IJ311_02230 [Elusimicrobiaceae bacterium]|nr:hypothetical protein [Elusimicrobiaceae bacterium]